MEYVKKVLYRGVLFIGFLAFGSVSALAATTGDAKVFVEKLGEKTLSIIKQNGIGADKKEKELSVLFEKNIDTQWIGRFVLGRYWRTATPEQQKRYMDLYRKFLIQSYVPHFREYTGEIFKVVEVTEADKGEFLVQTQILHPDQRSIRVDYRLREKSTSEQPYVIFDIVAEGVSLIATQRSDFSAIVAQNGIEGLLKRLSAKISSPTPAATALDSGSKNKTR